MSQIKRSFLVFLNAENWRKSSQLNKNVSFKPLLGSLRDKLIKIFT